LAFALIDASFWEKATKNRWESLPSTMPRARQSAGLAGPVDVSASPHGFSAAAGFLAFDNPVEALE